MMIMSMGTSTADTGTLAQNAETLGCSAGELTPARIALLVRGNRRDITDLGDWIIGGHPVDGGEGHKCFDVRCAL